MKTTLPEMLEPEATGVMQDVEAKADRLRLIQELAYRKAEGRGFAPGHEMEDWLEAEREVAASLEEA